MARKSGDMTRGNTNIRHLEERDYHPIIRVLDSWFDGRPLANLLPRIFFIHFQPTSFAVQEDNKAIGLLAGFVSQTGPSQAYIHFVAIHPEHRKRGWDANSTQHSSRLCNALAVPRFVALRRLLTLGPSRFALAWVFKWRASLVSIRACLARSTTN